MRFFLFLLLSLLAVPLSAGAQAASGLVSTPRAALLPVSATNRPLLAADHAAQPVNLAAAGYVEEEYAVSGLAAVYDWGATPADPVTVRTAGVPWTTRMLLRRPQDAKKFSGRVIVELLDATPRHDTAPLWGLSQAHFMAGGDVWVGLTVDPAAAAALQRFDPVRYAALSLGPAQAPDCRNAADAAQGGLAWDIIAQTGALLRSSSKENPLLLFEAHRIIAAGYARAGSEVMTYANALHALLRLGGGEPVYDGFLAASAGSGEVLINPCAAPLDAADPRRAVLPRDVPFVAVAMQTDLDLPSARHQDDSDEPGREYRRYEIAGATDAVLPAGQPAAADLALAGFDAAGESGCTEARSDFPAGLAFDAIWRQYRERLAAGTPMSREPRIETDSSGAPLRDASGNVRGGWRLPQIELPLAAYGSAGAARRDEVASHSPCSPVDSLQRYDAARLKQLYGGRGDYLRRFQVAVDAAVQARRLTPEDAAALKASLAKAVPAF
ncbi:MAG: alpha/beta hydrolase domain-containing protein [Steroidobacteraceae bacterium]